MKKILFCFDGSTDMCNPQRYYIFFSLEYVEKVNFHSQQTFLLVP